MTQIRFPVQRMFNTPNTQLVCPLFQATRKPYPQEHQRAVAPLPERLWEFQSELRDRMTTLDAPVGLIEFLTRQHIHSLRHAHTPA